jgi:hypothetical protein
MADGIDVDLKPLAIALTGARDDAIPYGNTT